MRAWRDARDRRAVRGRARAAAPRCAGARPAARAAAAAGCSRCEKSARAASPVAATTPSPSATAVPRPMPEPPASAPPAASAPRAARPTTRSTTTDDTASARVARATREVDRAHGVAADGGRQHLPEQQRDDVGLEEPPEARLATAARDQQQVPAHDHHERRDDVDARSPRRTTTGSNRAARCRSCAGRPARARPRSARPRARSAAPAVPGRVIE